MNKLANTYKKVFSKRNVRLFVYTLLCFLALNMAVIASVAWITRSTQPKTSGSAVTIIGSDIYIKEFTIDKKKENGTKKRIYDINDPKLNGSFLTGFLLDQEFTFTITLGSKIDSIFMVSIGMTGVDGGPNFIGLDGQESTYNMTDVYKMKLDSITPNSTPEYTGSYDYRWFSESKDTSQTFFIVSNFGYWDTSTGDLTFVFTLNTTGEKIENDVDVNEQVSERILKIGEFFVAAHKNEVDL